MLLPVGVRPVITLTIPEPTPSANKFLWKHWTAKRKERQKWHWLVKAAQTQGTWKWQHKAYVVIERHGYSVLDHDNFVGGAKFLMDSLVAEGFLVDDSPLHMSAEYHQFVDKPYRTVVKLYGEEEWRNLTRKLADSSTKAGTSAGTKTPSTVSGDVESTKNLRSPSTNAIQIADELL